MVRSAWEKKHAGALLDKDLSEVPTKTWLQFSHELLAEHEGEYGKDSDSYRYLKDILQGRIARRVPNDEGCSTTPVSDDERKSPKYQDLLPLARDKVNELLKQLNNDREPQHHDQE